MVVSYHMSLLAPAPGVDLDRTLATFGTPPAVPGVEKDDHDLARYHEIIAATRPGILIECGTKTGASANWFAERVPHVITIDIDPTRATAAPAPTVTRLIGSTTDSTVIDQVRRLTASHRTMVSLDSDHSRAHVTAEIGIYADLVTSGCYLIIEDGIYHLINSHEYHGDPLEAISATMPYRADYIRDLDIEGRYPVTGALAGWWRRRRKRST